MVSKVVILALAALCMTQFVLSALPGNYQSLTGQQKQDALWAEINKDAYPMDNLPSEAPGMFSLLNMMVPTYLTKAFTHVSDEMISGRVKLIHPYGTAAKVSFNIFDSSPYTGIFRPGQKPSIIRSSLAAMDASNFIPGVAVKVLIDAQPSANMFALFGLDGQGADFNYFANNFTTTLPDPKSFKLKALAKVFALALLALPGFSSERPDNEGNSPVYQYAQINEHQAAVYAPYKISFIPNPALGWDPALRTDFRAKLAEIPVGSKLWDVAAHRTATSDGEIIGEIVSQSQYVASPYQDEGLYFQHPSRRWKA